VNEVNNDFKLNGLGISNALGTPTLPRHRWYFIKEAFSPLLVHHAVKDSSLKAGSVILDPFSGSGTVPLVAAEEGYRGVGFELNPFMHFLSKAKLSSGPIAGLGSSQKTISLALRKQRKSPFEGYSTFTEGNRWNRWLFSTPVLRTFEAGYQALEFIPSRHRDLMRLALIGAAMDCCNAERDGKCLRYRKKWRDSESKPADFRESFENRMAQIEEDLRSVRLSNTSADVTKGDCRVTLLEGRKMQFDLCVTSPPYLNSFDYSDLYRPELFLGRFVASNTDLMSIRLRTIRSHVQARWDAPRKWAFGSLYQDTISAIRSGTAELWDQRIALMVQAYFEDLGIVLRNLRNRARPDASVWLVVSTSAYAGIEIPVDLILAEIGSRNGWHLREVGVLRNLRSSSQHVQHVRDPKRKSVPLRESVVILDASP
jgi:hypothetical protein